MTSIEKVTFDDNLTLTISYFLICHIICFVKYKYNNKYKCIQHALARVYKHKKIVNSNYVLF